MRLTILVSALFALVFAAGCAGKSSRGPAPEPLSSFTAAPGAFSLKVHNYSLYQGGGHAQATDEKVLTFERAAITAIAANGYAYASEPSGARYLVEIFQICLDPKQYALNTDKQIAFYSTLDPYWFNRWWTPAYFPEDVYVASPKTWKLENAPNACAGRLVVAVQDKQATGGQGRFVGARDVGPCPYAGNCGFAQCDDAFAGALPAWLNTLFPVR